MKQETLFFRLEVLSPLHIGCDEDYEPTNFVVDEKNSELINFNPFDFISRLDQEERNFVGSVTRERLLPCLMFLNSCNVMPIKLKDEKYRLVPGFYSIMLLL